MRPVSLAAIFATLSGLLGGQPVQWLPRLIGCARRQRQDERPQRKRHNDNNTVLGRLKDGVSFDQATEQMKRLSEQLDEKDPK